MKQTTYLFWSVVAAIGVVFVITVFTAVSQKRSEPVITPGAIPTPAEAPVPEANP